MDATQLLQQLGFSEYEARAYLALLQRHPMNGYAVAKVSGIPRANVYGVLQKLEDRAAVVRTEVDDGVAYIPVSPDDLIQRLTDQFGQTLDSARMTLNEARTPIETHYVENIQGYPLLLRHANDLIRHAQDEVLIALWQPEAQLLGAATVDAEQRGVAFTTLCFQACQQECGDCRGRVYRYGMTADDASRSFILVRDGAELLFGTIRSQQTSASRTKEPRLIEMTAWYIRHSIAVAAVLNDLGPHLEQVIKPETRDLLHGLGPGQGWVESVQALLHVDGSPDET